MDPQILIPLYCLICTVVAVMGGYIPALIRLTHRRQQLMMSLVGGVMLGVAMLHLLPHSLEFLPNPAWAGAATLAGVMVMFFLLRIFHVHAHMDHGGEDAAGHDCGHDHKHDHHHHGPDDVKDDLEKGKSQDHSHHLSWTGLFIGLAIHSLLDGVALAASVMAQVGHSSAGQWLGLGTLLAVVLHKPLDAMAITALMKSCGWSTRSIGIVSLLFALWCPLGMLLFWFGASGLVSENPAIIGVALALSAGFFLCIALADILPEVSFHSHDRVKLTGALLLGLAVSVAIESMHSHEHPAGGHNHGTRDGHNHGEQDHSGHSHAESHAGHDHSGSHEQSTHGH